MDEGYYWLNFSTVSNNPFNGTGYVHVKTMQGTPIQEAISVDGDISHRVKYSSGWTPWQNVAKKSDLGTPGGKVIVKTEVPNLDIAQDSFISLSYTNAVGIPSGLNSNRAIVLNMDIASNFKAQLAFSFGADKIAIRRKANSTEWTEWKYFIAS